MAATTSAETYAARRLGMVNSQLRTGDVVDQEVLAAFLAVPESFVSPSFVELAYLDREAPALGAKSRRLLPPATLAKMLQAAAVMQGDRALDVGGGSGYGAAILATMRAKVVALESDPGAADAARKLLSDRENVTVVQGPLNSGAKALGPFDLIVVEGAFRVPPTFCSRFSPTAAGWSESTRPWAPRKPQFTIVGAKRRAGARCSRREPRPSTASSLK